MNEKNLNTHATNDASTSTKHTSQDTQRILQAASSAHDVQMLKEDNTVAVATRDIEPGFSDNVRSMFDKVKRQAMDFVFKAKSLATDLLEENVDIPISQESVNGLIERYVVKNVRYFDHLEAQLHHDNFELHGDITVKGIKARVTGTFEVVTFEFNDQVQHMVFRQLNHTQIDNLYFNGIKTKLLTKLGLFYIQRILKKDPLAFALNYFDIATVTDNQYDFEIGRYFSEGSSVIEQLKRFQVKHAYIRNGKLYASSGVNMSGFFDSKPLITEDDIPEETDSILKLNQDTASLQTEVQDIANEEATMNPQRHNTSA